MHKQDIDQSYTSWLIYSDYLEENGQLNLAEQIRFELDYKPAIYPPVYNSDFGVLNRNSGGIGWDNVGSVVGSSDFGSSFSGSVGGYFGVGDYVGGHW